MAASYTLIKHGSRFVDARRVLAGADRAIERWDEGRAQAGYYRALAYREASDFASALRALDECTERTERLGLTVSGDIGLASIASEEAGSVRQRTGSTCRPTGGSDGSSMRSGGP